MYPIALFYLRGRRLGAALADFDVSRPRVMRLVARPNY